MRGGKTERTRLETPCAESAERTVKHDAQVHAGPPTLVRIHSQRDPPRSSHAFANCDVDQHTTKKNKPKPRALHGGTPWSSRHHDPRIVSIVLLVCVYDPPRTPRRETAGGRAEMYLVAVSVLEIVTVRLRAADAGPLHQTVLRESARWDAGTLALFFFSPTSAPR